jgi:hypothetical protein
MNSLDYISISQFLGTAFPTEIKTIDLFNNQYLLENPKKEHPVNYPAVYIEFTQTSWEDMTAGLKKGSSMIRFHIVQNSMKDTANIHKQSSNMQTNILSHYTLANQIVAKLEGYTPCTGLTSLSKVEEQNDTNHDQVIAEVFAFSYDRLDTDSSAMKSYIDKIITNFQVTGELISLQSLLN